MNVIKIYRCKNIEYRVSLEGGSKCFEHAVKGMVMAVKGDVTGERQVADRVRWNSKVGSFKKTWSIQGLI